jgi:hypothetical protein
MSRQCSPKDMARLPFTHSSWAIGFTSLIIFTVKGHYLREIDVQAFFTIIMISGTVLMRLLKIA